MNKAQIQTILSSLRVVFIEEGYQSGMDKLTQLIDEHGVAPLMNMYNSMIGERPIIDIEKVKQETEEVSVVVTLINQVRYNGLNFDFSAGDSIDEDMVEFFNEHADVSADDISDFQSAPQGIVAALFGNNPSPEMIQLIEDGKLVPEFVEADKMAEFIECLKKGNVLGQQMHLLVEFDEEEGYDS